MEARESQMKTNNRTWGPDLGLAAGNNGERGKQVLQSSSGKKWPQVKTGQDGDSLSTMAVLWQGMGPMLGAAHCGSGQDCTPRYDQPTVSTTPPQSALKVVAPRTRHHAETPGLISLEGTGRGWKRSLPTISQRHQSRV